MDGHGSNEVAEYVRDEFPNILKECEGYKERNF